jgi:FKBP-type peptidyl-prolyl cis-trans isomerase
MIRVKTILFLFFTTTIFFTQVHVFAAEGDIKELTTENDQISYALGFNIGGNIQENYSLNLEAFFQGLKDSKGGSNMLSDEQMQESLMAFQQQMQQKQVEATKIKSEENKAAGNAFLKANKTKEGVKTLASGLQYKVINKGDGASPKASDTVNCHYRGTTIDGKEFDSSYKRGKPASFQLDAVIKGWSQALLLMKTGSKWMLYIPEDLAYGDRGAGKAIEPGSTLIFEVELLDIQEG